MDGFPLCSIDDVIESKRRSNRAKDRESLPRLEDFGRYLKREQPPEIEPLPRRHGSDESSQQALRRMRDAQVRRVPVVNDMGRLVAAISIDDLVLVAQNVRASADAASVVGFHAVGRVRTWTGCARLVPAASSSRYRQPAAAGLSGDDRALTAPAAAKAVTCARNWANSKLPLSRSPGQFRTSSTSRRSCQA